MCGRFTLRTDPATWAREFLPGLEPSELPQTTPRYNIAPTQTIATVLREAVGGPRECRLMRWGLIPSWSDDPSIGARMINARGDTVAEKPSFRSPFKKRRCLVPADGYYEWRSMGGAKQPYFFHRPDDRPIAFAGLWEVNRRCGGDAPLVTCCLLTTEANAVCGEVHDRMPVILGTDDWETWLDPGFHDTTALQQLIRPAPEDWLVTRPVSRYVNNARHEGAACLADPE